MGLGDALRWCNPGLSHWSFFSCRHLSAWGRPPVTTGSSHGTILDHLWRRLGAPPPRIVRASVGPRLRSHPGHRALSIACLGGIPDPWAQPPPPIIHAGSAAARHPCSAGASTPPVVNTPEEVIAFDACLRRRHRHCPPHHHRASCCSPVLSICAALCTCSSGMACGCRPSRLTFRRAAAGSVPFWRDPTQWCHRRWPWMTAPASCVSDRSPGVSQLVIPA